MSSVIGIDPGMHTGLALFNDGKLVQLRSVHPLYLCDEVGALLAMADFTTRFRIVFEDSRLTTHLFTTNARVAVAKSMARKVGQVDMVCNLIVEMCDRLQVPAHGISPKGKGAKVGAERFAEITGWTGPSNEHTRDAAMVAWPYRMAAS